MTLQKVLITGSMRSGTTFLANFINANEDCVLLRDALLAIFRISPQLGIKTFNEPLAAHAKNIILTNLKAEMIVFGIDKLNDLSNEQFNNLGELFDIATNLLASKTAKVIGVKVTEAEDWLETIINDTDIKVIYLVRDLRDVLLSSSNMLVNYNRTFVSKRWHNGVSNAFAIKDPKMFFFKFEDLIQNPDKEVKKLSEFLGVELNPKVKQLKDVSNTKWVDNSSFHDIKKLFDPKAIFRWKNKLDSKEVKYGSVVYKKLMNKLGYEQNKVKAILAFHLKIVHILPFPRTRQRIMRKLKRK
ncbi:MAG: sulfotransferase domain-containing protein [Candidatus Heimdallarchaeota archaeon]